MRCERVGQFLYVDSRKTCGAVLDFCTQCQAKLKQQRVLDDLLSSEQVERMVQGRCFCHLGEQSWLQIHRDMSIEVVLTPPFGHVGQRNKQISWPERVTSERTRIEPSLHYHVFEGNRDPMVQKDRLTGTRWLQVMLFNDDVFPLRLLGNRERAFRKEP